ncbi:MAG: mechanosensitive ion channel family protein [Gammaproteobacteria bacterium]|nr:mechanosensitive ion channel family protein [Gammaproteobacteria bacterium]
MPDIDSLDFLTYSLFNNAVQNWLFALAVSVLVFLLINIIIRLGVSRLSRLAKQTSTIWDDAVTDALSRTHSLFVLIIALFLGSLYLEFPDRARGVIVSVASIALFIQGGLWLNNIGQYWIREESQRRRKIDPATVTTVSAMGFVSQLVIWALVVILLLDNLGFDVTALVTGLGIGGIAVALALQNILGDLFASLSIVLDKPFAVGDFLIIDEHMGAVENVGLKTTRIRSLSGEQLVFSNADLLKSRIRNYGRMFERRVVFKFGVTYQTPRDKLKKIPSMVRETIEAQNKVRFDRAHFQAYGASSLDFEVVYYVLSPDYNQYMDIQQAINLGIHERFEQEDIDFAYPTQTVYVHQVADEQQQSASGHD